MLKKKLKYLVIIASYGLFILTIIISINAIVPEEQLPILEENKLLIKKVENKFSRNKNSVYEILEKNDNIEDDIVVNSSLNNDQKKNDINNLKDNEDFRLQFASFKQKNKSLITSSELEEKFSKFTIKLKLIIKKVEIDNNQIYFRIISKNSYSFNEANKKCKILKKKKNSMHCY